MGKEARTSEEFQAQADMWKYVFGFTEMAVIKCAIQLGIADFLEKNQEPISLNQLSIALGCCSSSLYRILRFLINRGIFKETSTKSGEIGYVQTPHSRLLIKEGGNSMVAFLLFESNHVMLAPWHNLSTRILSKDNNYTSTFNMAHGKDIWKYWVLHDWGDEECIQILTKCREAIPKDKGKVIILEAIIGDQKEESTIRASSNEKLKDVALMLDMVMMAHTSNGKERTAKEWAYVLNAAGFSRHTISHINTVQSVIEAYPS
ncbi:unnamed protein product [Withania somnifera]